MQTVVRSEIIVPPAYRSQEAGLFLAQLDDQLRRLKEGTRGLTPEDLMWQPARGMNTIGMLLAHLAVVEVWWTKLALARDPDPDVRDVLGIGTDDDGLPLAEGAPPIALLDGKDLAFYDDLLDRARAYVARFAKEVSDDEMEGERMRERPDGSQRVYTVRWYFYHLLEHFAGHFGQILMLIHLRRASVSRP